MAKFNSELSKKLQDFIAAQHIFFVATAPDNIWVDHLVVDEPSSTAVLCIDLP